MKPGPSTRPLLPRLGRFLRRPLADLWLFAQAYFLLGWARLTINTVKFETLAQKLGTQGLETPQAAPEEHLLEARRISWAVRSASRLTPWQSNCFPQAVAAKYLLRRRGIPSTLYLGAAFKARSVLEAHAWLRCGSVYVTGGAGHKRYGTVGIYG
jgi:hypothetical protein